MTMSGAIENRIRNLESFDRLLLLLLACWSIVGIGGNYFRVHNLMDGSKGLGVAVTFQIVWTLVLAAIVGVMVHSMIRRRRRPADYGFSWKTGGVVSLALVAVLQLYLVISGKLVPTSIEGFGWVVWGAFMEELAFRAIAIDKLILLMDGIHGKAFWAVLASSTLFALVHIPSKSPSELQGIFISSLIMGYVYYKSRSVLLPAWYHGISNSGSLGGIVIVSFYVVISLADCAFWSRNGVSAPRWRQANSAHGQH